MLEGPVELLAEAGVDDGVDAAVEVAQPKDHLEDGFRGLQRRKEGACVDRIRMCSWYRHYSKRDATLYVFFCLFFFGGWWGYLVFCYGEAGSHVDKKPNVH